MHDILEHFAHESMQNISIADSEVVSPWCAEWNF